MAEASEKTDPGGLPSGRQNSYDRDDLLACARGELFDADSAKLPLPDMLMTDRISLISNTGGKYNKGEIVAELDIRPDLWFFDCHFVGDPVMPGCLGLDALWQLVGFFMRAAYNRAGILCWSYIVRPGGRDPWHLRSRR